MTSAKYEIVKSLCSKWLVVLHSKTSANVCATKLIFTRKLTSSKKRGSSKNIVLRDKFYVNDEKRPRERSCYGF